MEGHRCNQEATEMANGGAQPQRGEYALDGGEQQICLVGIWNIGVDNVACGEH